MRPHHPGTRPRRRRVYGWCVVATPTPKRDTDVSRAPSPPPCLPPRMLSCPLAPALMLDAVDHHDISHLRQHALVSLGSWCYLRPIIPFHPFNWSCGGTRCFLLRLSLSLSLGDLSSSPSLSDMVHLHYLFMLSRGSSSSSS